MIFRAHRTARWLGYSHPDPESQQLPVLQSLAMHSDFRHFLEGRDVTPENNGSVEDLKLLALVFWKLPKGQQHLNNGRSCHENVHSKAGLL